MRSGTLFFILSTFAALPSAAVTIQVNTTDNEVNNLGDCSLREAVQAANTDAAVDACVAGNEQDTILLPAGDYVTTELTISTEVLVAGEGAGLTNIDGGGVNRIFNVTSTLILEDLTLRNATGSGAAVTIGVFQLGTLRRVEVQENNATANGAIHNQGFLLIEFSTLADNTGTGAIHNEQFLSIGSSTISGNTSSGDGAGVRHRGGVLIVTSSTITGNTATGNGGGLLNDRVQVGGALEAATRVENTILFGNTAATGPDCFSPAASTFAGSKANLFGSLAGCDSYVQVAGDQVGNDPQLLPLANNGGATRTHALSQSPIASAAIDTGDCIVTVDQRSFLRPSSPPGTLPSPGFCDIGAYEISLVKVDGCTVIDNGDRTATVACSDGGSFVVQNGVDGVDGVDGSDGANCAVVDAGPGLATVECGDGSSVNIQAGVDGNSCTVTDNGDGSSTVTCTDGTSVIVTDGADGTDGAAGTDGDDCTVVENDDGTATINCSDGSSALIGGEAGCTVVENGDGSATITCADGTTATIGDDGDVGGGGCGCGAAGKADVALAAGFALLLLALRRRRR